MKKLKIFKIKKYEYYLKDEENKIYILNLEFFDLPLNLIAGNHIFISEKLLDKNYEEYDRFYRFGMLDSSYGRSLDADSADIIILDISGQQITLKRLYG